MNVSVQVHQPRRYVEPLRVDDVNPTVGGDVRLNRRDAAIKNSDVRNLPIAAAGISDFTAFDENVVTSPDLGEGE